jgi:hypothetical protein
MALRLHQAGRGEQRDLILLLYVHPRYVAEVARQHPAGMVAFDTATPTSRYRATGHGGIDALDASVEWALEESRTLSVGRVVVVGYSAGCMGVRAMLGDAGDGPEGWPDAVVAVDGIHSSRPPTRWQHDVWQPYLAACRAGERVLVASCTQILPPAFSGTRETIGAITGLVLPKLRDEDEPVTIRDGQLRIHVHPGRGRAAHQRQAADHLAPMVAEAMVMLGATEDAATAPTLRGAALPLGGPKRPPSPPVAPQRTLAAATLARALVDLEGGVCEDLGRNDGRRIREYCQPFGIQPPVMWCAVGVSTWIHEGATVLDREAPVDGSPGARALGAQFKTAGRYVEAADIRPEHLIPGNALVWARGDLSDPDEWRGHVGLLAAEAEGQVLPTVEPNSGPRGDRVALSPWQDIGQPRTERRLDDPRLLGIGLLTTPEEQAGAEAAAYQPTDHELTEAARLMALGAELIAEGEPADPLADLNERLG